MLDYYLDCAFFGSFFDDYGKYFIADIKACCSNKLHFDVLMLESIQLKLKQEKYDELFGDIDVHYGSDDYGINSYVRHKIGQDVAK